MRVVFSRKWNCGRIRCRVRRTVAATLLAIVGLAANACEAKSRNQQRDAPVSTLTFEELETQMLRNGTTDEQVRDFSDRLKGTRVRWSGNIRSFDQDGRVEVSFGDCI